MPVPVCSKELPAYTERLSLAKSVTKVPQSCLLDRRCIWRPSRLSSAQLHRDKNSNGRQGEWTALGAGLPQRCERLLRHGQSLEHIDMQRRSQMAIPTREPRFLLQIDNHKFSLLPGRCSTRTNDRQSDILRLGQQNV